MIIIIKYCNCNEICSLGLLCYTNSRKAVISIKAPKFRALQLINKFESGQMSGKLPVCCERVYPNCAWCNRLRTFEIFTIFTQSPDITQLSWTVVKKNPNSRIGSEHNVENVFQENQLETIFLCFVFVLFFWLLVR